MASTAQYAIPDVGSRWQSRVVYLSSGREQAAEQMQVSRIEAGRPVFSGETFGYQGEIIEGRDGTVIATQDCADRVPKALLAPPASPNQCAWGVCTAPPVGETIERKLHLFASLHGCEARQGVYRFESQQAITHPVHGAVTVGRAQMRFGLFSRTEWESHVAPGKGEVFGRSGGRETRYDVVLVKPLVVSPTPRAENAGGRPANNRQTISAAAIDSATGSAQTQSESSTYANNNGAIERKNYPCDIVIFGDSLTEGMGVHQDKRFATRLAALSGASVCCSGGSGATTQLALEGIDATLALAPRLTLVILGANDALRGTPAAEVEAQLVAIVDRLQSAGSAVILVGLNDAVLAARYPMWRELLGVHERVAQARPSVTLLPNLLAGIPDRPELLASDGLHPNEAGHAAMAETIWRGALAAHLAKASRGALRGQPALLSQAQSMRKVSH